MGGRSSTVMSCKMSRVTGGSEGRKGTLREEESMIAFHYETIGFWQVSRTLLRRRGEGSRSGDTGKSPDFRSVFSVERRPGLWK